ncbi:hypothetical protein [Paraburkholderia bannensis]|uniref:hypothetical protein n=1 Tax=Paraburkholderia bannensis TaxID=765414 RepID=UPI002AB72D5C|nr:hypothetical protein [Paraburkholderia bannensis]
MTKALLRTAFVAVIFIVVWAALYLWWRSTWHQPSHRELVLCGIALPIALTIGLAVARQLLRRPPATGQPVPPAAVASASTAACADPARKLTAALIDSSVRMPAGATTAEIVTATQAGRAVALHPDLERPDGTGVFAASVPSLSLARFDAGLLVADANETLRDEHRRALLLAADVLDELLERHAALMVSAHDAKPLSLHVLVPARWQREAPTLAAWLDAHAARERVPPGLTPAQVHIAANPVQACAVVDEIVQALHLEARSGLHVVLAFDSCATQQAVDALVRAGQLYGHDRPDGQVPGEGACVLLLAHPDALLAARAPRISRLAATRQTGIAHEGTDEPNAPGDALKKVHTQSVAGQPDVAPYGLVSDADQRNATRKEIVTLAERLWQDEAQARSHHLGLANGTSSPALALATLAVAAERVNATHQPILAALLGDAHARGAMLVVPADSLQPTVAGQAPPVFAEASEQSAASAA